VPVGLKVTEMLHAPSAATLPLQLLVAAKSPALGPVMVIFAIIRVPLPELVSDATWAVEVAPTLMLPRESEAGVRAPAGTPTPVPVSEAVWGLPAALSVTDKVADLAPVPDGEKLTEMAHVPPAPIVPPQLFVI
jgi:hypothetical protein